MTLIAYFAHFIEASGLRRLAPGAIKPIRRLFHRVHEAVLLANQRRAERHMARFVSTRGRFTDSLVRELAERAFRADWDRRD
jgi:hypothetical protein